MTIQLDELSISPIHLSCAGKVFNIRTAILTCPVGQADRRLHRLLNGLETGSIGGFARINNVAGEIVTLSDDKLSQWANWTETNLHRGIRPDVLGQQMRAAGLSAEETTEILGPANGAVTDVVDHQAIASCSITRRAEATPGLKKLFTKKAQVFTWEDFMSPEDCARTISLIEGRLRPSTVTDTRGDARVRTSSTCDLGEIVDPFVYELDVRMSQALGIHWSYSEPNQGQKYLVGQEFKSHTDYFEPGTPEFLPNTGERGQRTWTFMVYLNSTPEGGATRFPRLEKLFRPKQGMAVIWNNLTPEGTPNPYTLHHGMKPRRGEKYIITKWFREKGWGPMLLDD